MLKFSILFIIINNLINTCFGLIDEKESLGTMSYQSLWFNSLIATAIVSAAPVVLIFFIPDLKNHRHLLNILLAFAAGGLLGDAFLHLIPHSVNPHSHDDDHGHSHDSGESSGHSHSQNMIVGLWVVAGILSFLCVEKFVRLIKGENNGHSHSGLQRFDEHPSPTGEIVETIADTNLRRRRQRELNVENNDTLAPNNISHEDLSENPIKISGYLNLVADFTHNFTDGLAIGASFLVNRNVGIVTTITILLHEVPHEIGDFAILIQSGCSRKKAIMLQLVTGIGAMLGTIISLIAGDFGSTHNWILPYTAGGFIYISTVSVLPELIGQNAQDFIGEDGNSDPKQITSRQIKQSIKEIGALCVGVGMMVLIAYFE